MPLSIDCHANDAGNALFNWRGRCSGLLPFAQWYWLYRRGASRLEATSVQLGNLTSKFEIFLPVIDNAAGSIIVGASTINALGDVGPLCARLRGARSFPRGFELPWVLTDVATLCCNAFNKGTIARTGSIAAATLPYLLPLFVKLPFRTIVIMVKLLATG